MKLKFFIIILFLLIVTGAGFILILAYENERSKLANNIKTNLEVQTFALSTELEILLSEYSRDLSFAASYLSKTHPSIKEIDNAVDLFVKTQYPFLIKICFFNKEGVSEYVYPKKYFSELASKSSSFRQYFAEVQKTKALVISAPIKRDDQTNTKMGNKFIALIMPTFNNKRKISGYIVAEVNLDILQTLTKMDKISIKKNHAASYYLIDAKEKYILSASQPKNSQRYTNDKAFSNFIVDFSSGNKGHCALAHFNGGDVYLSTNYITLGNSNLVVAVMLPYHKSIVYSDSYLNAISLFVIFVLLVIVSLITIVKCNSIIVKKLEQKISMLQITINEDLKKLDIDDITQNQFFKDLKNNKTKDPQND